jgi:DNA-binding LacI/PurR family transcriptional regulator
MAGDDGKRMARITIDDLARKAGAHRSTISRALRGDVRIAPTTRDRIQRVAEKLGYEPSLLAKGLAGCGTQTIGVLTPRLRDGFYVSIVARQQELLYEQGFCMLMGVTLGGYGPPERQAITNLVSRGIDGLILNHVPGDP